MGTAFVRAPGWQAAFRACGKVEVLREAEMAVRFAFVGMPELFRATSFLLAVEGALAAMPALWGLEGGAEGLDRAPSRGAGRIRLLVTWRGRDASRSPRS